MKSTYISNHKAMAFMLCFQDFIKEKVMYAMPGNLFMDLIIFDIG